MADGEGVVLGNLGKRTIAKTAKEAVMVAEAQGRLRARQQSDRAAAAMLAQGEREFVASQFQHMTSVEALLATSRLQATMPGRLTAGEARALIQSAEDDRRSLFELKNQVRVPSPATGLSALDDPSLVKAFESGKFSFRRQASMHGATADPGRTGHRRGSKAAGNPRGVLTGDPNIPRVLDTQTT